LGAENGACEVAWGSGGTAARQGEAVAYDMHIKRIWHISEGSNPEMYYMDCEDGGGAFGRRMLAV